MLYAVLAVAAAATAVIDRQLRPRRCSRSCSSRSRCRIVFGRDFVREARLAEGRFALERRAEEVLSQEELAPRRWAERLAPEDLPDITGFEVGRVYQAGTGLMAGDFYDVFRRRADPASPR